jgi:hypothetical protein
VIDPDRRTGWEYHKDGEPVKVNDVLRAGELTVPLAELFADAPAGADRPLKK